VTTEERRPLDALLDLLVYAPVGFATSSRELMPELVAKGRQQVDSQVRLARMLGQFAVAFGKVEAKKRLEGVLNGSKGADAPAPAPKAAPVAAPVAEAPAPEPPAAAPAPPKAKPARPRAAGDEVVRVRRHTDEVPNAEDLAIPGYDALAASQVVARLEGLTTVELEQVRRYEQANRNRRTILGKVAQLEGTRS